MPFKTPKQRRFFEMCANNPYEVNGKSKCPPRAVLREFGAKKRKKRRY